MVKGKSEAKDGARKRAGEPMTVDRGAELPRKAANEEAVYGLVTNNHTRTVTNWIVVGVYGATTRDFTVSVI